MSWLGEECGVWKAGESGDGGGCGLGEEEEAPKRSRADEGLQPQTRLVPGGIIVM